jgi:hypothetical protein
VKSTRPYVFNSDIEKINEILSGDDSRIISKPHDRFKRLLLKFETNDGNFHILADHLENETDVKYAVILYLNNGFTVCYMELNRQISTNNLTNKLTKKMFNHTWMYLNSTKKELLNAFTMIGLHNGDTSYFYEQKVGTHNQLLY